MAGTVAELRALMQPLKDAILADVEQDKKVVEAVDALIKKIEAGGTTEDVQDLIDTVKAATSELSGDNAAVQAALDKAVPPTPPPVA